MDLALSPSAPPPVSVPAPPSRRVLGARVDATSYDGATQLVMQWARERRSAYVCATSVHGVIEGSEDLSFRDVLNEADLNTPDGMPLVWALRRLGIPEASRVYGPILTLRLCAAAETAGTPIGLYGGTPESLEAFQAFLTRTFPRLRVAVAISPPFRPPTPEEDEADTAAIVASGARIVFVGIGCPKQERWCAAHRGRIPAVMVAVGAAFDFHAGRVRQAPPALQRAGLEWAFRLAVEPRRLWRRYARIVPRFVVRFGHQLARHQLRAA
ncbi:WecB/TagA/CpsF family glycosyltransferase [Rubrivirga marina]|uniref:Glycosyltransferase n=1 Tax=Rubrivirga marina TaxID=1196024 RepID=A0A271IXM5_9BACT|nr:WecB/TagA/CpsF family glycosyltransferase [Rubrivirga marina]PAP75952.1 glycosyltransferase [Rubrivirga marina]